MRRALRTTLAIWLFAVGCSIAGRSLHAQIDVAIAAAQTPWATSRPPVLSMTFSVTNFVVSAPVLANVSATAQGNDPFMLALLVDGQVVDESFHTATTGMRISSALQWDSPTAGEHVVQAAAYTDHGSVSVTPASDISVALQSIPLARIFSINNGTGIRTGEVTVFAGTTDRYEGYVEFNVPRAATNLQAKLTFTGNTSRTELFAYAAGNTNTQTIYQLPLEFIGEGEFVMRDSLHLRSNVTVKGAGAKTILKKAKGYAAKLKLDGDYGEEQFTITDPAGFEVGDGVAIWDKGSGGFHTTVARITGRSGNTFAISLPLNADCMIDNNAQAATVFPVVSGYHIENARIENLSIDGNKDENVYLNGCRGAGIFLYRAPGTVITRCTVRNYNGDGISFQQSNDVVVDDCVSEANLGLGLHPGSGSQRPTVLRCTAKNNREDGLFLCWRVKYGVFEENILEGNGRYGISIGHKDTDNLLRKNQVRANKEAGIHFRNESEGMAGHRNRIEENLIENNGTTKPAPAIQVRGETRDLIFKNNIIRDTRPTAEQKQLVGIQLEEKVGAVTLEGNQITAEKNFGRWTEKVGIPVQIPRPRPSVVRRVGRVVRRVVNG